MKRLLLAVLLLPMFCFGQVKPKTGDNAVVISGSKYSIEDFARFLVLEGYEIDKMDKDLQYVTTKYRDLSKANSSLYRIKAVVKESSIDLSGELKILVSAKRQTFSEEPIRVTSLPTHSKQAFFKIIEVANKYGKKLSATIKTEKI